MISQKGIFLCAQIDFQLVFLKQQKMWQWPRTPVDKKNSLAHVSNCKRRFFAHYSTALFIDYAERLLSGEF